MRKKERERETRGEEREGKKEKRERNKEERERDRDREKDEESMRIGEGRKSSGKTDVPKLQAYNECEHPVPYNCSVFRKTNIFYLRPLSTI